MSAVVSAPGAHLRTMLETDIAEVTANDQAAYEYPWTSGIFSDCLRVGYFCRVLELNGALIGHVIVSIGVDEAHLLNLCIHPVQQGHGFGKYLLNYCLQHPQIGTAERMYLEVRPSNWQAIRLYQLAGFGVIGRRPNYYRASRAVDNPFLSEPREDALVMSKALS